MVSKWNRSFLETFLPLPPAHFFSSAVTLSSYEKGKRLTLLPDFGALLGEEEPAVQMEAGYTQEAFFFMLQVDKAFENCFYPEYRQGDSLELFLDTRNDKTTSYVHAFCHHFVVLPKEVQQVQIQEVTQFHANEKRTHFHPSKPKVSVEFGSKQYQMFIEIPFTALYKFGLLKESKGKGREIGFAYRLNQGKKPPKHFPFSSESISMPSHPDLWATLHLQ